MKVKKYFYLTISSLILIFAISYGVKIDTGKYCSESPVVRWKFAIYTGECDDETGCHFQKIDGTGIFEYFGIKTILCNGKNIYQIETQSVVKISSQDTLANVPETIVNGFVREYSADSSEIYESKFEDINGCKKVVEWIMYDKNFNIKSDWIKKYRIDSTQTCDFSAYIVKKNNYLNGKIIGIEEYFAASDESEEEPCGIWEYFDKKGKKIKTKKYGKCDISNFGRN